MDHAITVGNLVWIGAGGLALLVVFLGLIWFLAAYAKGMSR
jgi:hypothetical protein